MNTKITEQCKFAKNVFRKYMIFIGLHRHNTVLSTFGMCIL